MFIHFERRSWPVGLCHRIGPGRRLRPALVLEPYNVTDYPNIPPAKPKFAGSELQNGTGAGKPDDELLWAATSGHVLFPQVAVSS